MTDYHLFIAIYIIAVNLVTFGAWTGMKVWRHKTMHKKFTIGIPIVFVIHLFIVIYLHTIT